MVNIDLDIDGFMKQTVYPAVAKLGRELTCEEAKQKLHAEFESQITAAKDDSERRELEAQMQAQLIKIDNEYRNAEIHISDSEHNQELGIFKRGEDH